MKRKMAGQLDVAMPGMTPVPGADAVTIAREEKKYWEKRIKEESGPVKKTKCTPAEYLLLFGRVPEIEQVLTMEPEDLTLEYAQQLLDAGCPKTRLAELYGMHPPRLYEMLTEWGLHTPKKQEQAKAEEKATPEPATEPEPAVDKPTITWFAPQVAGPMVAVSETGRIRINKTALFSAPEQYHQSIRCRIGVNRETQGIIIQPDLGGYKFRRNNAALCCTSMPVAQQIKEIGVSLPARFPAVWEEEYQAWVGQLVKGDE